MSGRRSAPRRLDNRPEGSGGATAVGLGGDRPKPGRKPTLDGLRFSNCNDGSMDAPDTNRSQCGVCWQFIRLNGSLLVDHFEAIIVGGRRRCPGSMTSGLKRARP